MSVLSFVYQSTITYVNYGIKDGEPFFLVVQLIEAIGGFVHPADRVKYLYKYKCVIFRAILTTHVREAPLFLYMIQLIHL